MNKLPPELENPFDRFLNDLADKSSEYFKALNLTPNDLTSFRLIIGLYSVYLFTEKKYILSAIFYIISYVFDCFDGAYARKYKMTSKFGDYYDHVSDYIVNGLFIFLILKKFLKLKNNNPKKYIPLIMLLLGFFLSIHTGCQEIYHDADSEKILDNFKSFCPATNKNDVEQILKISRFFGFGTFNLVTAALIIFCGSVDKDIKKGL